MATRNTKPQSNEDWLKQRGVDGTQTFVNPNGSNEVAWISSDPYLANKNSDGQTYAQGTMHGDEYGVSVFDGAQNWLGRINGDGTLSSARLDGTMTPETQAALEAAKAQWLANGNVLTGKTKADYDAWVEASREAAREAYRNSYGKTGVAGANAPDNVAKRWANSSSNPGYNPSGSGFDINRIYDAQQAAALAALERSYNASLAGYNGAKDNINAQYYEEARKAQAQSDLERQRMNQMFNANGLANGGIGQASLAQNNALLGNLNALSTANAADLSTVDTALAKLQADYQGAVAEAIANNELERAQALYKQWQDEQARALQQEQLAYDRQMDAYNMMLKEQQYRDSQTAANQKLMQSQVEDMLAMKGVTSIPDYMIEASGYDPAYINAVLTQKAQEEAAAAAAAAYRGGGGGGGTSTGGTTSWVEEMLALGNDAAARQYLIGLGVTNAQYNDIWADYVAAKDEQSKGNGNGNDAYSTSMSNLNDRILPNGVTHAAAKAIENTITNYLAGGINTPDKQESAMRTVASIETALNQGRISQAEASYLLSLLGY